MNPRNKGNGGDHFDLLPFINILMCTLGCLLLVTLSLASLSLGSADETWAIVCCKDERPAKTPVLVEWDGETIAVHWKHGEEDLAWSPGSSSPALRSLLGDFEQMAESHYALFAVRPSGFHTFSTLRRLFQEKELDVGYEPIAQNRPVPTITMELTP